MNSKNDHDELFMVVEDNSELRSNRPDTYEEVLQLFL